MHLVPLMEPNLSSFQHGVPSTNGMPPCRFRRPRSNSVSSWGQNPQPKRKLDSQGNSDGPLGIRSALHASTGSHRAKRAPGYIAHRTLKRARPIATRQCKVWLYVGSP
jgi:hypothetical protein